jgi:transposase
MSLKPTPIGPIPELTAFVARAAFPGGNPYTTLRDHLGTFYDDRRFTGLFPDRGQPAEAPWRLALVTVMQFAEGRDPLSAMPQVADTAGFAPAPHGAPGTPPTGR